MPFLLHLSWTMFFFSIRSLGDDSLSTFQRCKWAITAHCPAQVSSSPGSHFEGVQFFPTISFPNDCIWPCMGISHVQETHLQSACDVVLALTWAIAAAETSDNCTCSIRNDTFDSNACSPSLTAPSKHRVWSSRDTLSTPKSVPASSAVEERR